MNHAARAISAIRVVPCPSLLLLADDCQVIGQKITNSRRFFEIACAWAKDYFTHSSEPGDGPWDMELPPAAFDFISSGIGAKTNNPSDYVANGSNDPSNAYLKRRRSLPVIAATMGIVTFAMYFAQAKAAGRLVEILDYDVLDGATHVITDISCVTPLPLQITWSRGLARVGTLSLVPTIPTSD